MDASSSGTLKQNAFNLQYLTKKFNAIILFSIHVKQKKFVYLLDSYEIYLLPICDFFRGIIKYQNNASNLKSFYQAGCQNRKKRFSTTKETVPGPKIFTL